MLLVDIGNTQTKIAHLPASRSDEGNSPVGSVTTVAHDQTVSSILSLAQQTGSRGVLVCSVSAIGGNVVEALIYKGVAARLFTHSMAPLSIDYSPPENLGIDRLAGALGARRLYPNTDVLIVDAGTAITYDFLSHDGHLRGGAISPGIRMRFKALNAYTARLPLVEPHTGNVPTVGQNTADAILSGVLNGVRAEAQHYISAARRDNPDTIVLFTGGDYKYFELFTNNSIFATSNLVLEGLATVALQMAKEP